MGVGLVVVMVAEREVMRSITSNANDDGYGGRSFGMVDVMTS